jgi:hypothetical protein
MGMVLEDSIEVMRGSTYEQVESEREDRGSKERTDVPLHYPPFKARRHDARRLPGGCQVRFSEWN